MPQVQSAVQGRLSTHGGQDGVWALFGNDFFNGLPGNGLDIGHVCRGRIGHDGGRVAIDQNDFVAFFSQGFTGLHARVVKLTGLADHNRTCADNQNAF